MNPPEEDRRDEEPVTVPVYVEAQQRELEEGGCEQVERTGKIVWRHPESLRLYPQGQALWRLRLDRERKQ